MIDSQRSASTVVSKSNRFLPHFVIKSVNQHRDETVWLPLLDFLSKVTTLRSAALGNPRVLSMDLVCKSDISADYKEVSLLGEGGFGKVQLVQRIGSTKVEGKHIKDLGDTDVSCSRCRL